MDAHPSPYLSNSRRLPDVLAAIQLMGAYTFSSLKYEAWVDKLGGPLSAKDWRVIFSEHPEFFRLSDEWVSLRWRHGYDRTYSHEQGRDLTHDEISTLGEDQKGQAHSKASHVRPA